LWERLFNIGCELYPIGCGFEREKRISNPSSSAKKLFGEYNYSRKVMFLYALTFNSREAET
jgi:hypothetical protein